MKGTNTMLNKISEQQQIQNQLPATTQNFWSTFPDNAFSFEGVPLEDFVNIPLNAYACEFVKSDKYASQGRDGFVIISVTTPEQHHLRLQTGAIQMVKFGRALINQFEQNPREIVPFVAIPHTTAQGVTYYPVPVHTWLESQEDEKPVTVPGSTRTTKNRK